jgi:hypothetical protein
MGYGFKKSSLNSNSLTQLKYERHKLQDITPECGCNGMIFVVFYISRPAKLINLLAVNGLKLKIGK